VEFGPEVEAISRKYLELRYRLLPYIYTSAWQASQTGVPVVRALSFEYPYEKQTYSIDDEFLCGDSVLAAPVVEVGAVDREVYLPMGEWYDFWTHQCMEGGRKITASAPLSVLPIFIKAGTVLPLWPIQQYVGERTIDTLSLHAFAASGLHNSLLYEDDGESPGYEHPSAHRISQFSLQHNEVQQTISLRRVIQSGTYKQAAPGIELRLIGTSANIADLDIKGGELLGSSVDDENQEPLIRFTATEGFELIV
jgi:alpha-glucosidase